MHRLPSSVGPSPAGRVMLNLHGPIRELAAALRTLADALDRGQASGAVTYAAAVEADAPSPAPGRDDGRPRRPIRRPAQPGRGRRPGAAQPHRAHAPAGARIRQPSSRSGPRQTPCGPAGAPRPRRDRKPAGNRPRFQLPGVGWTIASRTPHHEPRGGACR